MNNKLTLRMDESLIASAKDYAAAHGSSVSQMVANYFAALAHTPAPGPDAAADLAGSARAEATPVSGPVTRRLSGILKPPQGQRAVAYNDYHDYLAQKHRPAGPRQAL